MRAMHGGGDGGRPAAVHGEEQPVDQDPATFWDGRYGEHPQLWSGQPNRALVETVADLPVGRALELGCGEGADAVWLAEQGWRVTAVDVSATAIDRGRALAARRELLDEQIQWVVADLATWRPSGMVDLVTSCFLHSPVELPRVEVLRRVAACVVPGGHLLVVGHAEAPPWASGHGHRHFAGPDEEVAELALPSDTWEVVVAEVRARQGTSPDGEPADLRDSVVLFRRVAAGSGRP